MLKSANRKSLVVLTTLALAVAGCGKKEAASPFTDTEGLLRYVPADTPYFVGALEPAPDEFMDKMEPRVDEVLANYGVMLDALAESTVDPNIDDAENAEDMAQVQAAIRGMKSLMSLEALRGAGITRESTAVFYGNGLLPVLRMTVSDSALLDTWLSGVEEEVGSEMPVATVQGKTYRYFEAEGVRVVIGSFDNQFVLSVMPVNFDDDQLVELLGLTLPNENLADTRILREISDEYGYLPQYIGFISVEKVADTFIEPPSGLNSGLIDFMEYDASSLSDVCKTEFRELAGVMPRIVSGYESISAERIDSSLVVELREDIASGLTNISAIVPGLGTTFDGLLNFGMSVDVLAAREFYAARVEALESDPFECEMLADLQAGAVKGREALNQPVPPAVYGFRGFLAVITDIDGYILTGKVEPESVDGSFVLAMDNAQGLLAMAQMASPELYELDIQPDGKPHLLEIPAAQAAGVDKFWIALTEDALGVSLSEDGDARLPVLMEAAGAQPPPFMSMNMDAGRYYELVAEMMTSDRGNGSENNEELQAALAKSMVAAGELYDRLYVDVLFTERGIETSIDMTIAE